MIKQLLPLLALPLLAVAEPLLEVPFNKSGDLTGWRVYQTKAAVKEGALEINLPERSASKGTLGVNRELPLEAAAGRRLIFSAEFKGENIVPPAQSWNGTKFMVNFTTPAGDEWPQARLKTGTFDWGKSEFSAFIPMDAKNMRLMIGFQDSAGKLFVRNLKVEAADRILSLAPVANMGYRDETANDGKGGWSDQGPENDARNFKFKQNLYGKVPFYPVDPAKNGGKAVVALQSSRLPGGPATVELIPGGKKEEATHLYLLHTLSWGGSGKIAGTIDVAGAKGKQSITVTQGRDIADWWNPKPLPNAFVGAVWKTESGGRVGLYVSKFPLDPKLGAIEKVTLRAGDRGLLWIVAGVTLSDSDYPFPSAEKTVAKADARWKVLERPALPAILPGSALDRSGFLPYEKAGTHGRVIITPAGHFAFAKTPDQPLRFLSACDSGETFDGRGGVSEGQLTTKERIDRYVDELARNGYNLTRGHFIDTFLMRKTEKDGVLNPENLDRFDYYVHRLKEKGVYLSLDAMTSWTGYTTLGPWSSKVDRLKSFKFLIHFDESVRANWIKGVEAVLTHVNPYTKTRLADDPVLAMVVGFNEQEFAFTRAFDGAVAQPAWQKFLKERYGSIEKLKAAWGKDTPAGFETVAPLTSDDIHTKTPRGIDAARFILETERNTARWYRDELRRMGFPGPVSGWNMGKSFHYAVLRNDLDWVSMNSYHAHPSNYMQPGSTISQESSIQTLGNVLRGSMGGRVTGKPFIMTEYANTFWNRYRYEQAFVNGAYAAFQDIDGLTAFGSSINIVPVNRMHPFQIMHDPVARAMEFLTFFLYRRGDVTPAPAAIRLEADAEEVYRQGIQHEGLSAAQSKWMLVTGFSVEMVPPGGKRFPLGKRETEVPIQGTAEVKTDSAGFAAVGEGSRGVFDGDLLVRQLKERNQLPASNRTSFANDIYESSTGELRMEPRRNFQSVTTPRLQGICAEAGTKADLGNLAISELTVKGNLTLVSIDGEKPLAEAKRMVLVYATDALNSNMEFDDPERLTLRKIGGSPTLVETGAFTVTIRNRNAARLKLYPLAVNGARRAPVEAEKRTATEVVYRVDTAKLPDGPALHFELAE